MGDEHDEQMAEAEAANMDALAQEAEAAEKAAAARADEMNLTWDSDAECYVDGDGNQYDRYLNRL